MRERDSFSYCILISKLYDLHSLYPWSSSRGVEVSDDLGIGEASFVLSVLHGEADEVPVWEHSHSNKSTTKVPSEDEDGEYGKRAWCGEPVALEGNSAAIEESEDTLKGSVCAEDVDPWVSHSESLFTHCHWSHWHVILLLLINYIIL